MLSALKFLLSLILIIFTIIGLRCAWCCVAAPESQRRVLVDILLYSKSPDNVSKEDIISSITHLVRDGKANVIDALEIPQQPHTLTVQARLQGLQISIFRKKAFEAGEYVAYVLAQKMVTGQLCLIAYNKNKLEIGQTKLGINLNANSGTYVTFKLPSEIRTSDISYFVIDFIP